MSYNSRWVETNVKKGQVKIERLINICAGAAAPKTETLNFVVSSTRIGKSRPRPPKEIQKSRPPRKRSVNLNSN